MHSTTHHSPTTHTIWGLLDDRAGHANQVRGLVDALALPQAFHALSYNRLSHLPNLLMGATLAHLSPTARAQLRAPWPALVIACGRRTEPVARWIKGQSPHTRIVYIMRPTRIDGWDAVIIPEHDAPPKHDTILTTHGPLHRITPALMESSRSAWAAQFAAYPTPRIGVLLGDASAQEASHMLSRAAELAGTTGSLFISTSRRSAKGLLTHLLSHLTHPTFIFDYHVDTGDNPYLGILASSDRLIVSGDSLSMCVEAVASGAPTHIAPTAGLPKKHRALHTMLISHGHALTLGDEGKTTLPTNDTLYAAEALKARFTEITGT